MEFKEVQEFIDRVQGRLKTRGPDPEKTLLAHMAKLTEEVGELSSAILSHNSMQRDEKLEDHDPQNLPDEIADVLIVTLLIAKELEIDVGKALEGKIQKIESRPGKI